jgi:hypothetical protein
MMSSFVAFLDWCSRTTAMVYIRDSSFGMPAVQSFHLVGLTLLLGAMLVLNLRLAGASMMDWSLPSVERQLRPWALGAVTLVIASGLLMFLGNPPKYLASAPFRFKMIALCLAMVCQFGVLHRFFTADPGLRPRPLNVLVAGLSLTLWFSVGWAGRVIAFV